MKPKVYFACAVKGGGDTSNYLAIIETIKKTGAEVISEVFANDAILYGGSPLPANQIYDRDVQMIKDADLVVAEVSNPSLGVGYELGYAEKLHKPILCLYNTESDRKLSAMVAGNPYNLVVEYSGNTIPGDTIKKFVNQS